MSAICAIRAMVAPSSEVMSPVNGRGWRPWPRKSKVKARYPNCASDNARGRISCCDPAKPCAMITVGASAEACSSSKMVAGVSPMATGLDQNVSLRLPQRIQ